MRRERELNRLIGRVTRPVWLTSAMFVWQRFEGDVDGLYQTRNTFRPSFAARYVRVIPLQWHRRIGLSVELLGCTNVREHQGECVEGKDDGIV